MKDCCVYLMCIVVDSLSSEIPDTETHRLALVRYVPGRDVNAISYLISIAAKRDVLTLGQGVHQTAITETRLQIRLL